ncbi:MAG: hypothetical protein IT287_05220 [Bdellovibrionaceae bacterium]|nr:hypothetical protein [Pseudobdellovibrionaceae bacterium]
MNTVLNLARHMLRFQPNKDAARLCFYHFLIHHCEPTETITPQLLENFCRWSLSFDHWRQNRLQLLQEVQYSLHHFAETYQLDIGFKNMIMPDRWQVVAIENPIDCLKIFEKRLANDKKSRLLAFEKDRFLLLNLRADNGLTVTLLNNQMIINKEGDLEPLNTLCQLHYNADLSLEFQRVQYVEVAPNVYGRFMILGQGVHGHLVRGYVLQKADEFRGGSVHQHSALYYAIKKMEQQFVDRKSDPTYQELTQILEKAVELLNVGHPEAVKFAQASLERGEMALESLFPNDNMIRLLTQTLRSTMQSSRGLIPSRPQVAIKGEAWVENKNDQLLVE